jgi:hypothetical protein
MKWFQCSDTTKVFQFDISKVWSNCCIQPFNFEFISWLHYILNIFHASVNFAIPCSRILTNAKEWPLICNPKLLSFRLCHVHFINNRSIQKHSFHIKVKHFPRMMCCKCHKTLQIVLHWTTWANVSWKFTPSFCSNSQTIKQTLSMYFIQSIVGFNL